MDSDEEDTFVTVGTPLPVYEENEAPKKPITMQEQVVRDAKGRQRFHGAFTGGFSAGYFNTVSTPEGWAPSTFTSTRDKKPDATKQTPEDFMDEEDFGEHGIAPRKISTATSFTPVVKPDKKRKAEGVFDTDIILGQAALQDIIVPNNVPMGVRLLRKMGWREGQGVGPRVKKKSKATTKQQNASGGNKVYGCAMDFPSDDSEESEDEYAANFTFAPKDTSAITFDSKDNLHGLGYSGLNTRSILGPVSMLPAKPVRSETRKGFFGQAFGVGAFEEEDDDIYGHDHISNYHTTLGGDDDKDSFGWTPPKAGAGQSSGIGHISKILEGFCLSNKQCKAKKIYPAPQLPRGFQPLHTPLSKKSSRWDSKQERKPNPVAEKTKPQRLTASDRAAALGETPQIKSVFDLVSDKDKNKIDDIQSQLKPSEESESITPDVKPEPSGFKSFTLSSSTLMKQKTIDFTSGNTNTSVKTSNTIVSSSLDSHMYSGSFKPFASNPVKQDRYEKYRDFFKKGIDDPYSMLDKNQMTEWECQQEREEFSRAAALFKPISSLMACRFTHGKHEDSDQVSVATEKGQGEESEQAKAVELKMFGRLTRDQFEWHPDKLLCKRFNVPNPYPDSGQVGLLKVKRDKFSVFNFLSFPSETETQSKSASASATPTTSTTEPASVPLAIEFGELIPTTRSDTTGATHGSSAVTDVQDSNTNIVQEESAPSRPSMDLFKAIFADTDSESSSDGGEDGASDNDAAVGVKLNKPQSLSSTQSASVGEAGSSNPATGQSSEGAHFAANASAENRQNSTPLLRPHDTNSMSVTHKDHPSVFSPDADASVEMDTSTDVDSSTKDHTDSRQYYGPALPAENTDSDPTAHVGQKATVHHDTSVPGYTSMHKHQPDSGHYYGPRLPTGDTELNTTVILSGSSEAEIVHVEAAHRKAEKRHKRKHKHRHNKEKHEKKHKKSIKKSKKDKKRKKKKHKKKNETEETSSNDGSSEDSGSEGMDKLLLNRLRSLPDSARKRAADFM